MGYYVIPSIQKILYAGRGTIYMKHISWVFSLKAWVRSPGWTLGGGGGGGGGAEAKIKLFQNMAMLHIKLKGTTYTVTC